MKSKLKHILNTIMAKLIFSYNKKKLKGQIMSSEVLNLAFYQKHFDKNVYARINACNNKVR